jgi:hypothetical protein
MPGLRPVAGLAPFARRGRGVGGLDLFICRLALGRHCTVVGRRPHRILPTGVKEPQNEGRRRGKCMVSAAPLSYRKAAERNGAAVASRRRAAFPLAGHSALWTDRELVHPLNVSRAINHSSKNTPDLPPA